MGNRKNLPTTDKMAACFWIIPHPGPYLFTHPHYSQAKTEGGGHLSQGYKGSPGFIPGP